MSQNTHYMLIDGANIDGVLGQILGRQPTGRERPRWDHVMRFSVDSLPMDKRKAHFFIATDGEQIPQKLSPFIETLKQCGIKPWLLTREGNRQVVDEAINKVLARMRERGDESNILLLSHDSDYVNELKKIREMDSERVIAILGFPEYMSNDFDEVEGLRKYDLEHDVTDGFIHDLPRIRVITIDAFEPDDVLDWQPASRTTSANMSR